MNRCLLDTNHLLAYLVENVAAQRLDFHGDLKLCSRSGVSIDDEHSPRENLHAPT
jgi:hypothetical protein